jgi:S-(hydroxymethyl)glutathione dehydrogenase / alcohol dehydrogenase
MKIDLTFNAAVLRETGKYPSICKVTFSDSLYAKQVLVRILVSGICGKQIEEYKGDFGPDIYLPHMLGHEAVGIVESIGPDVDDLEVGDQVVMHWLDAYTDNITPLPEYHSGNQKINAGYLTTLAEYCVTRSNKLTKVPIDCDPSKLYLLGCGLTTGLGCVFNEASVQPGDKCLIIGLGGVGLSVAMGINLINSASFDIFDTNPEACIRASFYKPRFTYGLLSDLMQSSNTYNKIFYCIGNGAIFADIYTLLELQGLMIMVGVPNTETNVTLPLLSIHRRKTLTGSHGGSIAPRTDIPHYARKICDNSLNVNPLVGKIFPLCDIEEAFYWAEFNSGRTRVKCSI